MPPPIENPAYELKGAICSGKLEKVKSNFSQEALKELMDKGDNPIMLAIMVQSEEVLNFLFENMTDLTLSNTNKNGSNFLHMIVDYDKGDGKMVNFLNEHSSEFKCILNDQDRNKRTPIEAAIVFNKFKIATTLFQMGSDLSDKSRVQLVIHYIDNNELKLFDQILSKETMIWDLENDFQIIKAAVSHKASMEMRRLIFNTKLQSGDFKEKNKFGDPLMHSIVVDSMNQESQIMEVMEILQERRDTWVCLTKERSEKHQRTLLHQAIISGRILVARKLIEFKAPLTCLNDQEDNIFHACCDGSNNKEELTSFALELLDDDVHLLNQFNKERNMPIHQAVIKRRHKLIQRFLNEGSMNVAELNHDGHNILHLWLIYGLHDGVYGETLDPIENLRVYDDETLKKLINTKNSEDKTPGMLLIKDWHKDLAKSFFDDWKEWIDLSVQRQSGSTLLTDAIEEAVGNYRVYSPLVQKLLDLCQCQDPHNCVTLQEGKSGKIPINTVLEVFETSDQQQEADRFVVTEIINMLLKHKDTRKDQVIKALSHEECSLHKVIKKDVNSLEFFNIFTKDMSGDKEDLAEALSKIDSDGNSLYHLAAQDPINEDKLVIIHHLLILGVDPCLNNRDNQTFLQMSANVKPQLLHFLENSLSSSDFESYKNLSILHPIIRLADDDLLSIILNKIISIEEAFVSRKGYVPLDLGPLQALHPIFLIGLIQPQKETLPKSFALCLQWEATFHEHKEDKVKRCCYEYFDRDEALEIFTNISSNIHKPLRLSYYFSRAFQSFFIISFLLKLFDFATDMALNFEYFSASSKIIKDFPPAEACANQTIIACYFHDTPENLFFILSMAIFALTYAFDITLVLLNPASKHYLAVISGHCCWSQVSLKNLFNWVIWIYLIPINLAIMFLYDFWIKTFTEYWKNNDKEIPRTACDAKGCLNCDCVCICCGKQSKDETKLAELSEKSFKLCHLARIVTFSTENALMPLLQLSVLLPNVLYLFPKEETVVIDYDSLVTSVESNWRFIVTSISIGSSLFSMGYSLTDIYFSKKERHKTLGRWLFFFLSIIFQIIPKILAYQVLAFGFWSHYLGNHYVIAYIFIMPVFLILVRVIMYWIIAGKPYILQGLIFAMSTIYTFNNFAFKMLQTPLQNDVPRFQQDEENQRLFKSVGSEEQKRRLEWVHIAYDTFSFIEVCCITPLGADFIIDRNFDPLYFTVVVVLMESLGLILASTYYLYLHPWKNINPRHDLYQKLHSFLCLSFLLSFMITIICYSSHAIQMFALSLLGTLTLALLVRNKHNYQFTTFTLTFFFCFRSKDLGK